MSLSRSAGDRLPGIPITVRTPVAHPGPPPHEADVVVIGGGIVGLASAWHLARAGLRTVLVEKGRLGGEQSGRNWGWIRQQGRDLAELPIMMEANRLWNNLAAPLKESIGLSTPGVIYMAGDEAELARFEAWAAHAGEHQLDTRLLTGDEVAALLPGASQRWLGGLHTPSDMKAEPWLAVPALARAAVQDGLRIVEGCAARGLERSAGRISAVVTEGGTIRTSEVVVAGGAWSRLFLQREEVRIPQLSVRATVCATHPVEGGPTVCGGDDRIGFRRRSDGGYTLAPSSFHELFVGRDAFRSLRAFLPQLRRDPLGTRLKPAAPKGYPDAWATPRRWDLGHPSPFEAMRVLDPAPRMDKAEEALARFRTLFPSLGDLRLRAAWAGMIDTMPDVVPVIDREGGLTIATGMSGHGFGIGPGVGRVVADLVRGRPPGHDLSRFRRTRFTDGSSIDFGAGL